MRDIHHIVIVTADLLGLIAAIVVGQWFWRHLNKDPLMFRLAVLKGIFFGVFLVVTIMDVARIPGPIASPTESMIRGILWRVPAGAWLWWMVAYIYGRSED